MRWIVSFALFLVVGAAWALASPISSGPDEPSRVIHAAAIPWLLTFGYLALVVGLAVWVLRSATRQTVGATETAVPDVVPG